MKKFVLFILNVAIGLTLAIQVLIHPALDSSAKITFLLAAVIFINWAVFTWLAYSSAMKEKRLSAESKPSAELPMDDANQRSKSLLDVMTIVYLVMILLALISLNVLVFLELTKTTYLVWIILAAILIPLIVTWIANKSINRTKKKA